MTRSITYVEQTDEHCTELQIGWTDGRYTATVARYGTAEPVTGLLVRTSLPITMQAAEKAAQYRSATFWKFVAELLPRLQAGEWDFDLDTQANETGE